MEIARDFRLSAAQHDHGTSPSYDPCDGATYRRRFGRAGSEQPHSNYELPDQLIRRAVRAAAPAHLSFE
ncbi:MAG: hypothetical protein BGN95_22210 [Sphingomonas sp. 66-10]|nr:MAG: hypothetical protein BGN95_22210 [Sphingomonas sp. 66-10]